MSLKPADLIKLALSRHREPWNWTFHIAGLCAFALCLLFHSYLLFASTLIFIGTGFYALKLRPMRKGRWLTFQKQAVEWEKDWIAYPWTYSKWWRFLVILLVAAVFMWALWTRDIAVLCLYVAGAYFVKVVRENKAKGIDL